jgi:hypothetical protein
VFAAEGLTQDPTHATTELGHPDRTPSGTLNRYPVDILAIEETSTSRDEKERYWARWLDACTEQNRPNHIIISASTTELVEENGLQSKVWRKRYSRWGYSSDFWFLRGHEQGGVVRHDRCLIILSKVGKAATLGTPGTINTEGGPRIARNMLKPANIPSHGWSRDAWSSKTYPEWIREATSPCLIVGESDKRKIPVFSPDGCLPDSVGALIDTDRGL